VKHYFETVVTVESSSRILLTTGIMVGERGLEELSKLSVWRFKPRSFCNTDIRP
jgi:hypothetical protein